MANIDNPNGFKPYVSPTAQGGQAKVMYFDLAAANSVIGIGDPVYSVGGVINIAATGSALMGIAAEAKAASSGGKIAVWADPEQWFVAQTDDGTGTATDIGGAQANADIVAGTPVNGKSIAEIDEDTATTTATLTLKLIRLSDEAGNAYGENNRWVVKINNHQLGSHTGTAGT